MASVYFVFAHPHRNQSRAGATILKRVADLPHVTVCDLYETYPDFHIQVEEEKRKMLAHEVIVLQHPFYWYSMPPLLKLWLDEVFELGFAYGPGGTAFRGKTLQLSITAGGPDSAYQPTGYNRFTMDEYLKPYDQTAHLCGMRWPRPLVLHGANSISRDDLEAHAERVRDLVLQYSNPHYTPMVHP